jgi:hypothetical protein
MKPTEALEIQRDYRFKCGDKNFRYVLNRMMMSASGVIFTEDEKAIHNDRELDPAKVVNAYAEVAIEVGKANTPCYFVKDEMTDLILFASNKLDDTDLFDANLVPSDYGFVYFEKPLELTDVRGRQLLGNVLVWKKGFHKDGKIGIMATLYNDADRTPDDIARTLLENKEAPKNKKEIHALDIMGRYHWIHSLNFVHGEVVGEKVKSPDNDEVEQMRRFTFDDEGKDVLKFDDEAWEQYKKDKIFPYTNIKRLIHTYFLIMSQTITATTPERGDRAQRRRLERENLPSEVMVIQFRKTRYTSTEKGEEVAVNWSHRWIVGGHWRWQPYKDPASGGEIKKRIWINPYVKGPDDKPLKTKERVYVLAR